MNIEIKSRYDGHVLVSGEFVSLKACVEAQVKAGANLTGADLRGANLTGANLTGADLRGAKSYKDSHDIYQEIIRRQPVSVFVESEWSAIAQITIHRLCWDTIQKRFSDVIPHVFEILAKAGFAEWQDYWNTLE